MNKEEVRGEAEASCRSCDSEEEDKAGEGQRGVAEDGGRVGGAGEGGLFIVGGAPDEVGGAQEEVGGAMCRDGDPDGSENDDSVTVYIPCNSASHGETSRTQAERRPLKFAPRVPSMDKCPLPPENDVCLLVK